MQEIFFQEFGSASQIILYDDSILDDIPQP
jgi:hypothetical protein